VSRISKIEYGCLIALSASARSEDPNTKVGCAIENSNGKIISTGYNGLKNEFELNQMPIKNRKDKLKYFIHAETNALAEITKGTGKVVYLTHSPCQGCAQNIIAHGIEQVIYIEEYHSCKNFKQIFDTFNIKYRQISRKEREHIYNFIKQLNFNLKKTIINHEHT
jgi:dCMP deaminase